MSISSQTARLDQAEASFRGGNYAATVRIAREVLADLDALPPEKDVAEEPDEREELRRRAEDLLTRVRPDPSIGYLLAISAALLLFLALFAYTTGHP